MGINTYRIQRVIYFSSVEAGDVSVAMRLVLSLRFENMFVANSAIVPMKNIM